MCYHLMLKTITLALSLITLLYFSTVYYRLTDKYLRAVATFTNGGITVGVTGVYLSFIFRQRNFQLEFMMSLLGGFLHAASGGVVISALHSDPQDNLALEVAIFNFILCAFLLVDSYMDILDRNAIKIDTARLRAVIYQNLQEPPIKP